MPTTKQLIDGWKAQFKLGLSQNQAYCNDYSQEK
jgi:hypothetical protein